MGKRQHRRPGGPCSVCFTDIMRQHRDTFPTCAESSKEASPKQDKAGAPDEAFAQAPFRMACRSRPRQTDFLQLSSLCCCPCQGSNYNKVKTDGWQGRGGVISSSFPGQHLKDTSESQVPLQLNQHSLLIWLCLKIAIPGASTR